MSAESFTVTPLQGSTGAEITGLNLADLQDNQTWDAVHQAFLDHKILAIRDQKLTPDDIMSIGARFGAPCDYPFVTGLKDHPFIFEIIKEPDESKNFGGGWHTDSSYLKTPPLGTMLYAIETPTGGGDTLYTDTSAAYDALSEAMQAMLSRLTGVNSAALKYTGGRSKHHSNIQGMAIHDTDRADEIEAEHPVIRTHPETGKKSLYVSRSHTQRFKGMTEEESKGLIAWLQAHIIRPEFITRVAWRPGTLTIWDNRCTQHSAMNDYHGQRRHMQRLTVGPEVPV